MAPKKTESAGGVVLNPQNEIALVRNGPGLPWWGFPKGHIDPGEDALEAALREIYEETGLRVLEFLKPLGSYERFKGKAGGGDDTSELKLIHMFLFLSADETLQPIDSGNPEARWVSLDGVESMLTHEKDREFFVAIRGEIIR